MDGAEGCQARAQRVHFSLDSLSTEYCGNRGAHEYQLYLALENIDHSRTRAKSPQTNGICERFHRTVQEEFYSVAFRKKLYTSLEELQVDLDGWLREYNQERVRTPGDTASEKLP